LTENIFFFIINPNAGNNGAKREWETIEKLLKDNNINFEYKFTEATGHAEAIVKEKIAKGFRNFVVVGGDGTLNEVSNGIFKQKEVPTTEIYIGIFSMGTGNDWIRYFNIPTDYSSSIDRLIKKHSIKQDVGKIKFLSDEQENEAYFLNVAGLGLDSKIVQSTNVMKVRGKRTKIAYFRSLFKGFIKYKSQILKISIEDEIIEGKILSMSIGNGKFSGGGMQQTPNALNNDGLLDVTIYPNMTKFQIALAMPKLYSGKIEKIKGLKTYKTTSFSIENLEKTIFEIDGEIIDGKSFEISILPLSINVII
jgi:YegS/Rv2252/BmrU family lipid kinase